MKTARRLALSSLRPPMKLRLSEWAEKELRLPEGGAVPGPLKLYAYQRGIADAITDPAFEKVSVLKSARIGYTMLLTAAVANFVVNDPSNILSVFPTDEAASRFVVSDLEPTFAASPKLRHAFEADRSRKSRNRIMAKRFPGGELRAVSAIPRNLNAHTSRVVILDEVDRMEQTVEGSPIALAEKRTLSFRNRKILVGSTPRFTETSFVIAAYNKSDQRIYEVPCPACGEHCEIQWKDIKWPPGEPAKAFWCAPCCGAVVEESDKLALVEKGRWRATKPEVKGHAGFKVSSLISPLPQATWGKIASEFVDCGKDPTLLQAFFNTLIGEGWDALGGEGLDETVLFNGREPFGLDAIPEAVLSLVCGVDVQHDRLEATIIGHDRQGVAYVLSHQILYGRWDDSATWADLDDLLKTRWPHPLGGQIGIDAACVDSSDGVTMDRVYDFCFPRSRRRIMAVKGRGGNVPWIVASRTKRNASLWIVGVDGIKRALFDRLQAGGFFRFSEDLDLEFFEQLNGERLTEKRKAGVKVLQFVPVPGRRHEVLDCVVYALAAHKSLNIDPDRRESELRVEHQAPARPRVIKSEWATAHRN
jgi:phage terminase large subunit GpA-like protein